MRFIPLIVLLLLSACGKPPAPAPTLPTPVMLPQNYKWITVAQAESMIQTNHLLGILDTRDSDEMRDGHGWINGALPCGYLADNEATLKGLDRNRPWLVYCTIGGRAELTAATMAKLDFKEVYLLKGGFADWRAQGKPTIK